MHIWIVFCEHLESNENKNYSDDVSGVDIPVTEYARECLVELQHQIIKGKHLEYDVSEKEIKVRRDGVSMKVCRSRAAE